MSYTKEPIAIRPYTEGISENMGLEQYNMVVHDGAKHMEQLMCIERNGQIHYITGLNEYAPEVELIKNPEAKAAKIKQIRTAVAQLERELAFREVDPDDEHFWEKIELLHPKNIKFWEKISLAVGNNAEFLNPENPNHRLLLYAIEAGGFTIVAKSYEDAKSMSKPPKFYLDKQTNTASSKTELKKLKNKAFGKLDQIFNKQPNKLLYIVKHMDTYSPQYKETTPKDILYDAIDTLLSGNGTLKVRDALDSFMEASEMLMEDLKLKAMIKDASIVKLIFTKADGIIYHKSTGTMLGRNVSEVLEFFKDPVNSRVLDTFEEEVNDYWSN